MDHSDSTVLPRSRRNILTRSASKVETYTLRVGTLPPGRLIGTGIIVGALCMGIFTSAWTIAAPYSFPEGDIVEIPEGATLETAATILQDRGVIRSKWLLRGFVSIVGDSTGVIAGNYFFDEPLSAISVAWRITRGIFELDPVRVTIPEGSTSYQIGAIIQEFIPRFNTERFVVLAKGREGYLFPDTYFLLPNVRPDAVIRVMERAFEEEIATIQDEIEDFGKPLHDIITMASLIEREARNYEDRQLISGILWKRLEIGMPLQVDAVFGYIKESETYSPSFKDLEIESKYNTYKYKGLPPGPIANPGLEAIKAAVHPIESDYLFYLTGRDGKFYYGETFKEHVRNRVRYLN